METHSKYGLYIEKIIKMINQNNLIRTFDILLSLFGFLFFSLIIFIVICINYFKNDSVFFFQERVGINLKPFKLIKFKTMISGTKNDATHLIDPSSVTNFGKFLRKFKLDELPQLLNVLIGDMSLVGPRPNLLSQDELIKERSKLHIYNVRPGITGLAQVNNIDMSDPKLLAITDAKMVKNFNLLNYFKYILLTIFGNGFRDKIKID